jgi:hypothetical protein
MIFKHPLKIILGLVFFIQLTSCNCVVRTYAPFSETIPAIEEKGEIQAGGTINLLRGEAYVNAAPVNHIMVSAVAGARIPFNLRYACTALSGSLGYFGKLGSKTGLEIMAGFGKVHFENLKDTITCGGYNRVETRTVVNTNIDYRSLYIKSNLWFKEGNHKLILSAGLRQLYTPHFNYYVQEFREMEDSTIYIYYVNEFNSSATITMFEPAIQYRYGNAASVYAEIKGLYVLNDDLKRNKFFDTPKSVISIGFVYCFRKKKKEVN